MVKCLETRHPSASFRPKCPCNVEAQFGAVPLECGEGPVPGACLISRSLTKELWRENGRGKKNPRPSYRAGLHQVCCRRLRGEGCMASLGCFFSPPHLFAGESPWWMTLKKCKVFLRSNKRFRFCNIEALFWKHVAPQNLNSVSYL